MSLIDRLIYGSSIGHAMAELKAWQALGEKIRDARKAVGVGRAEMADRTGMTGSAIRAIENGAAATDEDLVAIGRALDMSATQWIERAKQIRIGSFTEGLEITHGR